jgi:hypothetical protein
MNNLFGHARLTASGGARNPAIDRNLDGRRQVQGVMLERADLPAISQQRAPSAWRTVLESGQGRLPF